VQNSSPDEFRMSPANKALHRQMKMRRRIPDAFGRCGRKYRLPLPETWFPGSKSANANGVPPPTPWPMKDFFRYYNLESPFAYTPGAVQEAWCAGLSERIGRSYLLGSMLPSVVAMPSCPRPNNPSNSEQESDRTWVFVPH